MPIYEYQCQDCGAEFELLVSLGSDKKPACPECGSINLKKKISRFSSGHSEGASCNIGST